VAVTVVVDGYRPLTEFCTAITRRANSAKVLKSRTPAKLYVYETLLERSAQDLEDMAAALGQSSRKSTPLWASDTSPGIGTWPPPISPASEMVGWGGATRAGRHQHGAVAGEAGDTVDVGGLKGLGQGHHR
jgi:hypothetical protein